jgi:hypothetical protein
MKKTAILILVAVFVAVAGWRIAVGYRAYHEVTCSFCNETLCQGRCGIKSCNRTHKAGQVGQSCDRRKR